MAIHDDGRQFKLKVNGKDVAVHSCSVSAAPINIIWPGHQRSSGQAEKAFFANIETAGQADVEIEVAISRIDSVEFRPNVDFVQDGQTIRFTAAAAKPLTVLINGLHHALHLFFHAPFVHEPRENEIYFGPGVHDAGVILPEAGQTVCLDKGAYVYGAIVVYQADNVTITGCGILDSSKIKCPKEAVAGQPGGEVMAAMAAKGLGFREWIVGGNLVVWGSHNVKIHGITLVDSPSWSVITRNGCSSIEIDGINIVGQWRYNSDGIDLCTTQDSVVRNCFIRTFDDCLVVRAPYLYGETEQCRNLCFSNCTLWCDWGKCLEIWCGEMPALTEDIVFEKMEMIHLTDYAISIHTTYGSNSTVVKNVTYRDMEIFSEDFFPAPLLRESDCPDFPENRKEQIPPLIVMQHGQFGHNTGNQGCQPAKDVSGYHLTYENIHFENIITKGRLLPIVLKGDKQLDITGITLKNVPFDGLILDEARALRIQRQGR